MRMNRNIEEIEINFSNVCAAECIICSRPHGVGNSFLMSQKVFFSLVEQLKDIDFNMFQTSGNGEAFLNPNYLNYISVLKSEFSHIPRWTYNNFSMWNKEVTERVIKEDLFDRIHVRIDSLHSWIFEKNSNLNKDLVFQNLIYFLERNHKIPMVLLYNNIKEYYNRCFKILGKRPSRDFFTDEELSLVSDEEQDILEYFSKYTNTSLTVCKIAHSLWGERRTSPKDTSTPCPKIDIISNIIWVCPNGDVSCCCYDDSQNAFIVGNILETHLLDIFNSDARQDVLERIRNRQFTEYPCINPKCCGFPKERVL